MYIYICVCVYIRMCIYMAISAIFRTFLVSWGAEQLQPASLVPSTQKIRRKDDFSETMGFGMVISYLMGLGKVSQ